MPRFFLEELDESDVCITGPDARHIGLALRMRVGEMLTVCAYGRDYQCRIRSITPEEVHLDVVSSELCAAEPSVSLTLYQAVPKADKLEQIIKQLNKLLHVLKIVELDPNTTVERELVLIKVAANESNRSDVLEIVRLFRVRVVDVNPESLTIEATGAEGKIDALLGLLEHYGVIELVRSGAVAVTRGPKALSEKVIGSEIKGR